MDRGAWQAMIHTVAQSRTQLQRLRTHARTGSAALQHVGSSWTGDRTHLLQLVEGFFTSEPPGKPPDGLPFIPQTPQPGLYTHWTATAS